MHNKRIADRGPCELTRTARISPVVPRLIPLQDIIAVGCRLCRKTRVSLGRRLVLRQEQDEQQLKTCTRWWNSWLQKRGITVTVLCEEIKDGVISMKLIELLSDTHSLSIQNPSGIRAPYQRNENHGNFFDLLKSMNIPLGNIGPADMVRADNLTPVLGLTWTLIQRFEEVENDELLDWVNTQVTNDYDVKVTNWHTSFNDGLALCAVLNKLSPQVPPPPPRLPPRAAHCAPARAHTPHTPRQPAPSPPQPDAAICKAPDRELACPPTPPTDPTVPLLQRPGYTHHRPHTLRCTNHLSAISLNHSDHLISRPPARCTYRA